MTESLNHAKNHAYVLGWPVKHSRSPKIHSYWLQQLGLSGTYGYIEVSPENLAATVSELRANGFAGANITVPHKEAVFALCDTVTAQAKAVGAANTIWLKDGMLHGDNTDIYGFAQNLTDFAPHWRTGQTALVFGAGGAARAILYALVSQGYSKILLVNRGLERAESLAAHWPHYVEALNWESGLARLPEADLLVNTTSLGMSGQPPLKFPLEGAKASLIINDIVYVPLQTDLLKQARSKGLTAVDGLGMLLHQAVPGFQHWFGKTPQVTPELRGLIEHDIPL